MGSPHRLSSARTVTLAAALLALSGTAAPRAAETVPAPVAPKAENKPLEQAIHGAIALVHDEAGFAAEFPIGTFSDGIPDARPDIARAVRQVPEIVSTAIRQLDPQAPPAGERANDAARKRLATFAGEHTLRRALGWYEPLLFELAPDMPEAKLTPEQVTTLRRQLREWQAKASTYQDWARNRGGDLKLNGKAQMTQGRGPFADVPTAHPAYGAVEVLTKAGVFSGYPDNTFSGKRALTRYEFAVAIQRMLQDIQRMLATPAQTGHAGTSVILAHSPSGPIGKRAAPFDRSQALRMFAWLRALTEEFDLELAMLGSDIEQLKRNLDALQERAVGKSTVTPPATPNTT